MARFIMFMFVALALFLTALFNMFVLSKMWVWYITPAFNIPCPQLYIMFGLIVTASFFIRRDGLEKSFSDVISDGLSRGLSVLVIGWAVQAIFA